MINKFRILNEGKCFFSRLFQNYLVAIPATKYIKYFSFATRIGLWKSNEMSEENIKNITEWDKSFAPALVDHHVLSHINVNGHCLIHNKISITIKVINLCISYILNPFLRNLNTDFTLNNYLFGSVNLTKNAYPDKYK